VPGRASSNSPVLRNVKAILFSSRDSALLLLIILCIEVGVGAFAMRDVFTSYVEVQKMYGVTVRGLQGIGELQYEAQETRRSTLYAMTTNDANLQVNYADQSRRSDSRVTAGITQYLGQARTPRGGELGKRLARDWAAYLAIRDRVLSSILEGSVKEAMTLDLAVGVPAFDRVRQDLEEIKQLYNQQASQQVAVVAASSERSAVKLVCLLGFGLLFGSFAVWAIQSNKIRAAVQLARLQMEFVASVSHELRTPITAILTAGENIRDGVVDKPEGLVEQGSIITEQAARLMQLVNQVLEFTASTWNRPLQSPRRLQISEVVAHALQNTAGLLKGAGFTVEQNIEPGLPSVIADLSMLSQCLQNLITNAVKFSNGNRWIGLSARTEKAENGNHEVLISVRDRGLGISRSDLPYIFDPFYRSPRVVAAQIHGTGLGLYIAQRSAEAFGGRVSIITELGVGSVLTIHLPVPKQDFESSDVSSHDLLGTRP
jgi:signal transduction histidine kinase